MLVYAHVAILQSSRISMLILYSQVTEIGPRNSSTGETPILFYIIDGSNPVPASTVVDKLASLPRREIGGYSVSPINITV